MPGRSPDQKPPQSHGNGTLPRYRPVPNASPASNTMSSPVATTSTRAAKNDAMVTQANFEPESIPNQPRDERLVGLHPGAVAVGPIRHTVASGETFGTIAQRDYGSDRYAKALPWANRGLTARPQRLTVGDLIVIPTIDQLDASRISPVTSKSTTAPVPASPPAPFPISVASHNAGINGSASSDAQFEDRDQSGRRDESNVENRSPESSDRSSRPGSQRGSLPVHVVRRYETIRSIARDRLGNSRRADEIIELNHDRLSDSNELVPGQRLLLPGDAGPAHQAP